MSREGGFLKKKKRKEGEGQRRERKRNKKPTRSPGSNANSIPPLSLIVFTEAVLLIRYDLGLEDKQ